jgi:hypothetical protein
MTASRLFALPLAATLLLTAAAHAQTAAPAAPAPQPAARQSGPASPVAPWRVVPIKSDKGVFAYCIAESVYSSGHGLIVARTQAGDINVAVGVPGAKFPKDQQWTVRLSIDSNLRRDRAAMAAQPDLLVVANGRDDELYNQLKSGNQLVVESAADRIVFLLQGTGKALTDLKTCADKAGNVPIPPEPAMAGGGKEAFPPTLTGLLEAAGLKGFQPIPQDKKPEERAAAFRWHFGPLEGGLVEAQVQENATLEDISTSWTDSIKQTCKGKSETKMDPVEDLKVVTLRTGVIDCETEGHAIHFSFVSYLPGSHLFTVFFHKAVDGEKDKADLVRNNIATVLREAARREAEAPAAPPPSPEGASAQPPAAQPPAAQPPAAQPPAKASAKPPVKR